MIKSDSDQVGPITTLFTHTPNVQNVRDLQNYQITQVSDTKLSARMYTPFLQWVDVVDISLSKDAESGAYKGDAW